MNPSRLLLHFNSAITYLGVLAVFCTVLATYRIILVFYRLCLSPLAKFPGPKIAAATGAFEFYHDFFRQGKYVFEIKKMHEKYGPIVRINPHELSIHDPTFYSELYVSGSVRRTNNYNHFARGIDFEGSHFLSTDHDLHRRRRKPLEPFFSRLGVTRLESMIAEIACKLSARLERSSGSGQVTRLDHAFAAFSGDIIFSICCGDTMNLVDDPQFGEEWYNLLHDFIKSIPLVMGLPQIIGIVTLVPEWVLAWLEPRMQTFKNFKNLARTHIIDAKNNKKGIPTNSLNNRNSIFCDILTSDLPEYDLSVDRLSREAQVLLGAGTVSTARTLDFISFYIMADEGIRSRLQSELRGVMRAYPEKLPSWSELEKLPYLQALIKEGLRLSYGVMHRLPRVSPDRAIRFREWVIPAGIPVGMSAYMMHTDPRVYPDPFKFIPNRWIGDVPAVMNRNLVPFSRGSRNCLGMNLAYAELYIMLAILFRPGGPSMTLFQTDETDIIQAHDFLIPLPKLTSKGLRIIVK